MADFAEWATACETAVWDPGTFAQAYSLNRARATTSVIEEDLIANAVVSFMARRQEWRGETKQLCVIRRKAATDSEAIRPLIPTEVGHPFRSKPATLVSPA
jgi:hypothetical protein